MTAKRKPRGVLARLDALEEARAAHVEEVSAGNWAVLQAAEGQLSAADRAAWDDAGRVLGERADPDALARIRRACAHLPDALPLQHLAKEDAGAWADVVLSVPEGVPLLAPPADRVLAFLAYFQACATWCDGEAVRVPLSPDVHRLARWGGALWRLDAALCAVLAGDG